MKNFLHRPVESLAEAFGATRLSLCGAWVDDPARPEVPA